jgi:exosortase A-associated hydrolase 1
VEIPVVFECRQNRLIGIVHQPEFVKPIGILLVVGGPQYRVGSHRQFVLLARFLAGQGYPVMRFDYRGMGDSEGDPRSFAHVDDDIAVALDVFYLHCKGLKDVVIWGLCDAASAALFYAYQDERVRGLVLLNPWIYTEQGAAKTYLKHYYLKRFLSRDFWSKVIHGQFNVTDSLTGLFGLVVKVFSKIPTDPSQSNDSDFKRGVDANLALPVRMLECLKRFKYPVLLILSGRDLTADEFKDTVQNDLAWQSLLNKESLTRFDIPEADHTFSSEAMKKQVEETILNWLNKLG